MTALGQRGVEVGKADNCHGDVQPQSYCSGPVQGWRGRTSAL